MSQPTRPVPPDPGVWAGRRVLLTGHTGFKGAWLAMWLSQLEADVVAAARAPHTAPSLFEQARVSDCVRSVELDLRQPEPVRDLVREFRPDVVFHLAAQALVRESYRDPVGTFAANVMGTVHLLEAIREARRPCSVVVVTSDKVYRNREENQAHRETDALGGSDPYSASKAATEIAVGAYRDAFLRRAGVAVATARAGNVIGGGDWAPDRLIPDAIRAWQSNSVLTVRHPSAMRPWQHVLEALNGYLVLGQRLLADPSMADGWNFGPPSARIATVRHVIEIAAASVPGALIEWLDTETGPPEAECLMLDTAKARDSLGVFARWTLEESIVRTMEWHRHLNEGANARDLCMTELAEYRSDP